MVISFPEVFAATLPIFLLLGLGVYLRRADWLPSVAEQPLMRVIVFFFYPALILQVVGANESIRNVSTLAFAPLVGFLSVALGFAVAYFFARRFGLAVGNGRRTFAFNVGIYNFGYLAIPLVLALYGRESGTLAVLFVHNVGVDLAFWTVGILLIQGAFNRSIFRKAINPPLISLCVAVFLNLTGLYGKLPEFLLVFLAFLGDCAIPLGIILAGCSIGDLLSREAFRAGWKTMTGACLLRLGLLPVLFLLCAIIFPFERELKQVIAVQAAMPAGVFPLLVTRVYAGREDVAVCVVVSTVVISILTTPLWIQAGLFLLREFP